MKTRRVQIVTVDGQDLRIIVPPSVEPLELVIRHARASAPAGCGAARETPPPFPPPREPEGRRWPDGPLAEFLRSCCDTGDDFWVSGADLQLCYAWWCRQQGQSRLGKPAFRYRLETLGFEASRSRRDTAGGQLRTIEGLRIKAEIINRIWDGPRFAAAAGAAA